MTPNEIINGVAVFVGALIVISQVIKRIGASAAKAVAASPAVAAAQAPTAAKPAPLVPRRRLVMPGPDAFTTVAAGAVPFAPRPAQPMGTIGAVPRQARDDMRLRDDLGAADAFPGLDLTLPDADAPAVLAVPRRAGRTFRGNVMPGAKAWGANAVVAMEILGPPVSLRSGATLGAPHAF